MSRDTLEFPGTRSRLESKGHRRGVGFRDAETVGVQRRRESAEFKGAFDFGHTQYLSGGREA